MDDLRARFIARFGTDLAETVERVVESHIKVIPGVVDLGSDPFQFSLVWAVGFECLSNPGFRAEHGVVPAWADLEAWIRDEADLASFDGTMDLGGRGRGRTRMSRRAAPTLGRRPDESICVDHAIIARSSNSAR